MSMHKKWSDRRSTRTWPWKSFWRFFGFALLFVTIAAVHTRGNDPRITELERHVKERVRKFSTIDLAWEATTHFTQADGARLRSSPFGNEPSQTSGAFPATFQWRAHLWCDGDKMRLEHARPVWMFQNSRFETPQELLIFDGDVGKFLSTYADNSFSHQGIIRNDPMYVIGDADFSQFVWHFRAFTYSGMLAEYFGSDVEVSQGILDGRSCTVLKRQIRRLNGSAYEQIVWLDTEAECAVRRNATLLNGKVVYDHRLSYYRDDDGHVVPKRWKFESYDQNGRLLRSISAEVIQITINQPISGTIFQLEFPEGTMVADQRGNEDRRLLIGAGGREYEVTAGQTAAVTSPFELLESLRRAEADHWNATSGILIIIVATLIIAVLIAILRRHGYQRGAR